MATTITGLAGTQLTDGSHKVHVTGTIADAASAVLALVYEFKHASESTWSIAVTDGPKVVNSTPAGVALDFLWDLDASSIDDTETANFDFRVSASAAAVAAAGSVTAVAANATTGLVDGDVVAIAGQSYEIDTDNDGVVAGNIAVVVAPNASAGSVQTALANAIRGNVNSGVTVATAAAGKINFTAKTAGAAGNVAITETLGNAGVTLTPVGLAGGADAVEAAATASITLTGATTGGVAELPSEVVVPALPRNTVYVSRFEKLSNVKGATPQDFAKGAAVYARLDALREGTYDKFGYSAPVNGEHVERAVLISVAEFERVAEGKVIEPILQSKQWLAHKAWRSLVQVFADPETVIAVYESTWRPGNGGTLQASQTVVAYLLSSAYYEALRA